MRCFVLQNFSTSADVYSTFLLCCDHLIVFLSVLRLRISSGFLFGLYGKVTGRVLRRHCSKKVVIVT